MMTLSCTSFNVTCAPLVLLSYAPLLTVSIVTVSQSVLHVQTAIRALSRRCTSRFIRGAATTRRSPIPMGSELTPLQCRRCKGNIRAYYSDDCANPIGIQCDSCGWFRDFSPKAAAVMDKAYRANLKHLRDEEEKAWRKTVALCPLCHAPLLQRHRPGRRRATGVRCSSCDYEPLKPPPLTKHDRA